ncbi:Xylulose kinase [Anaerobiospirillum thomasii]|uniref:xylulokinase n=1 Tax=Anaerobiospirillum thomasii TaxID=179995 RepID=UPI000D9538B1|nr:xylulokinase [Anaerobiospirillum thomasii]SPT67559.1 Xylulose kinase [Anaerobiospirillum thomasii]SPT67566.1 Xylulose kinase [Anaerobiospirillum thomasii]SPT71255.1 Xylulose kinase [Anaerobiospirillum thomasii]
MSYFTGIDCGTQSTKVVIVDTDTHKIIGEGSAAHDLIADHNGKREQEAEWWIEALVSSFKQALNQAQISGKDIKGIGVSGQQHGFVPVDKNGKVICPVKLWCDTSTAKENQEIIDALGGTKACIEKLGIVPQTGYTVSKILNLKKNNKELYEQLDSIMLPHDYINFYLTGNKVAEYGDASGTGLLNVKTKSYSKEVIDSIDNSGKLESCLNTLIDSTQIVGTVRPEVAKLLGVTTETVVSSGGGDNMMSAIGTGNIKTGIITMSLGTSGTLFTYADNVNKITDGQIANFCSSTNGYLPLICTMNVTSATSIVQNLLETNLDDFNHYLQSTQPGANGLTFLPFFNGERIPALPNAKASLYNIDATNFTNANLCVAATEGATFGLRYAIDLFRKQGIAVNQIRLTGGGSKSQAWREIVSNTVNSPVVCLTNSEAASLGAAIQVIWASSEHATQSSLISLCNDYVGLDASTQYTPDTSKVSLYEEAYQRYLEILKSAYPQVQI